MLIFEEVKKRAKEMGGLLFLKSLANECVLKSKNVLRLKCIIFLPRIKPRKVLQPSFFVPYIFLLHLQKLNKIKSQAFPYDR